MRALETTLPRPQQSNIKNITLLWSRERCSECENKLQVLCESLKDHFSTSPKSHFGVVKRKKMSSLCPASTFIIAFSTSGKSNFGLVKRQKMTFKCNSTICIIALSHMIKDAFSVGQESYNDFKVTFENLNHPFFDFIEIAF